jgi:hypothetical protein
LTSSAKKKARAILGEGGLFWLNGKTTTIAFGRYLDQLERRNDQWRIVTRRSTIEMTADTERLPEAALEQGGSVMPGGVRW